MGDCLIVCLNSDDSVRRLKGEGRPVMGQADRAELLEALSCVDAVEIFDEDTPERAISRLRPHVWAKGGDYRAEDHPETSLLRRWGGQTPIVRSNPDGRRRRSPRRSPASADRTPPRCDGRLEMLGYVDGAGAGPETEGCEVAAPGE